LEKGAGGFSKPMLSYDKQLKTLSQHLRKNMTDAKNLLWLKSPLPPLCQRGEEEGGSLPKRDKEKVEMTQRYPVIK